jgi:hypothetical protein
MMKTALNRMGLASVAARMPPSAPSVIGNAQTFSTSISTAPFL